MAANSYSLNYYGSNGNSSIQLTVGSADVGKKYGNVNIATGSTTLTLFGRNYTEGGSNGYGRTLNQNYVDLLQNFADDSGNHANANLYGNFITGQIVFEKANTNVQVSGNMLYLMTGTGSWGNVTKYEILTNANPAHSIAWGNDISGYSNVVIDNLKGNILIGANGTPNVVVISSSGSGNVDIKIGNHFNYNYSPSSNIGSLTADRFYAIEGNGQPQFYGNGSGLFSIEGGNVANYVPLANIALEVSNAAQPIITSVGTLTGLNVSGNIVANNITSNGVMTSNVANVTRINISNVINSTLATGTAPLAVLSTTKVANLNVDLIDGYETSLSDTPSTVVIRTTNGDIAANGITANTLAGSLTTGAQPNITSVGTLSGLTVGGSGIDGTLITSNQPYITDMANVTFSGNITVSGSIKGTVEGNATSNVGGGNANFTTSVTSPSGTFTSNVVSPTGNITTVNSTTTNTTNAFITTGNITTVNSTTTNSTNAFITTGNITTVNSTNINTSVLNSSGEVTATGNVTAGNLVTGGNLVTTGTANVGTLKTTSMTTGATGTSGSIIGTWTLASGSTLQSTYADLAEYYTSELDITPGTVVEFGGTEEIQLCDTRNSTRVAGIVSTDPAFVMNEKLGQSVPRILVALIGRVPCKVYGTCAKGDMMVAAGGGYAMANNSPAIGSVIGKALEDKTTTGVGVIEVVVGRL
jgi:hypothetical protein